ncbi:MAG: LptF/LptG family permease, partial [Bacteroidaceae bacterium]|nr:LptF/LptG family permease [Bacteroidaceae bacterium]
MSIIKKLDKFILNKFLLTFAAAFMISLFVFMMQFTWRYVDELIGKGLSLDILVQFFWYMGLSLVPTALPLAVLLASLITFGNMGEQLELLAMKAAGVPLIRIMRPILVVGCLLCGVSF